MVACTDWVPALYFRKWVAIDNFRLYVVQTISYILIAAGVIYVLIELPNYHVQIEPKVRHLMWIGSADPVVTANPGYCAGAAAAYDYRPDPAVVGYQFASTTCAQVSQSICEPGVECLQLAEVTRSLEHETFIATAYTKEVYDATTGLTVASSHVIPGAEDVTLGVNLDYQIELPMSIIMPMLGIDMLPTSVVNIVMLDTSGAVVANYLNDAYNRLRTMSLRTYLDMAGVSLDDPIQGKLTEFPDNTDPIGPQRPKARITGMSIVIRAELSNSWSQANFDGLTAKITVQAIPSWNSHMTVNFLDSQGSTETTTYYGVSVKVAQRGVMSWFQLNEVIYTWSLYSAWLQIPFYFVFYFAVCCLGTLSSVFTGFLYESVDLHQEFNGTSARMLELTYGFHDVHDAEEQERSVWGVTRERLQNRMDVILEHDQNLDKAERTQFTNYIFDITATSMPSGNRAIHLEDYRNPHMTNENLLFNDVLQIVDSDRSSGNILERLFMDDSLKEFSATAEKAEQKILGKVKAKRSMSATKIEAFDARMTQARRQKTLKVMGTTNTIARCKYGQEIADAMMTNLEEAFNKMHDTCDQVTDT